MFVKKLDRPGAGLAVSLTDSYAVFKVSSKNNVNMFYHL